MTPGAQYGVDRKAESFASATCVALVRPVTCTAPAGSVVVPLPSWPDRLEPQASTVPFDFSASTWRSPAESWVIPLPAPIVFTGRVTGVLDRALPSSPALSSPQAHTVPSVPRTVANPPVAEIPLSPRRAVNPPPAEMPAMYREPGHPLGGGVAGQRAVAELAEVVSAQVHTEVIAEMPLVRVAMDES